MSHSQAGTRRNLKRKTTKLEPEENKNQWQWFRMKARREASSFKVLEKKWKRKQIAILAERLK